MKVNMEDTIEMCDNENCTCESKEEVKNNQKISYDQLTNICNQLQQKLQEAYIELQKSQNDSLLSRLHYLFEVIKYSDKFNNNLEFVNNCTNEIVQLMTIVEEPKEEIKK